MRLLHRHGALAAARFAAGTLIRVFERELATGESYYLLERAHDHAAPSVIALASASDEQRAVDSGARALVARRARDNAPVARAVCRTEDRDQVVELRGEPLSTPDY
ncbi:MAG TPA: hypothetical protein VN859_07870 [Steroidobacteraceae bacterium]|nr:hypothetical protein [Steroidobacteraceae bacterium]